MLGLQDFDISANITRAVSLAARLDSILLKYTKDRNNPVADIQQLREELQNLQDVFTQIQILLNGPHDQAINSSRSLESSLTKVHRHLEELDWKLGVQISSLKCPLDREEIERLLQTFQGCRKTLSWILHIEQIGPFLCTSPDAQEADQTIGNTTTNFKQIDEFSLDDDILEALPVAKGAAFDSDDEVYKDVCLPGTQIELLNDIQNWAGDSSAKTIFWFNGMPGTGKSTVARTVCQQFAESGQLAASFFFKRGETDRGSLSKFATTIAAQLAKVQPSVAPHIKAALHHGPELPKKTTRQQLERLIEGPLGSGYRSSTTMNSILFVIDALDESGKDNEVRSILDFFLYCARDLRLSLNLKCFITSRTELPARLGFDATRDRFQDLILYKNPSHVIEHDIATFLEHELLRVKTQYNGSVPTALTLPSEWPGKENIQALTTRSVPLFIFATTACRFIGEYKYDSPDNLLKEVTDLKIENKRLQLDAIYTLVLGRLTKNLCTDRKNEAIGQFQQVVAPVVVIESALSKVALEKLLDIPKDLLEHELGCLHPVFRVPESEDQPVRLLNSSFCGFLTGQAKLKMNEFWVDVEDVHKRLAANCLRVMNSYFKEGNNRCEQPGPFQSSAGIEGIQRHIPPEMQYACLYWVHHIQQGGMVVDDYAAVIEFLRLHISHWLEILSCMNRVTESIESLEALKLVINTKQCQNVRQLIQVQEVLWLIQAKLQSNKTNHCL